MQVTFSPKAEVWRGRGHPRRHVPQEVRDMADRTYRSGKVGRVTVNPAEEEEAAELIRLLKSYAKSLGRRMRIQRDDDELRFELVDVERKVA